MLAVVLGCMTASLSVREGLTFTGVIVCCSVYCSIIAPIFKKQTVVQDE